MKPSRVGIVACLAVPLLASCSAEPVKPVATTQMAYSCCEAKDVDTLYQPGQTVTVHWTVQSPDNPAASPPQVELAARLTGPYATVDGLKAATADTRSAAGEVTFTAAPVRPSGAPDERPVSTIAIGPDAKPGYYSLITSIREDGDTADGAGIVRVVPKT
jgi:hypothetical protein